MAGKDYYTILGVSHLESPEGIRDAYRKLAKKHHPDCAGPEATGRFQEISEAYCVLSDPASRDSYDRSLRGRNPACGAGFVSVKVGEGAGTAFLYRGRRFRAPFKRATSEFSGSLFEELFEGHFRDAGVRGTGMRRAGASTKTPESREPLRVEVVLTSEEARQGGILPLGIPVLRSCPFCGGSGSNWPFPCYHCLGHGVVEEERMARISIAPMIKDGATIEVPTDSGGGAGTAAVLLRIRVLEE